MNIRVKDIMMPNPITVDLNQTVFHLKEIMLLHQPECLLVLDSKKALVGILTPNNLATAAAVAPDEPIEDYMIKTFKKINANATIQEAASLLLSQEVEALPVVDNNDRLIGVVNYKDIVKDLVDDFSQKLTPESAVIYLAMTKDPEQEE
ncbi:CBS domain-containing protein, partial [bacterium]|nr:CBS domain-containing protein [bacterium]